LGLVNEADAAAAVGRKLRLAARDLTPGAWVLELFGPEAGEEFTIRGVLRAPGPDEVRGRRAWARRDADVVLPAAAAEALAGRLPIIEKHGFGSVLVEVDDSDNVKEVTELIRKQGLHPDAMLERVEVERFIYHMVFSGMSLVAAVA